MLGENGLGRVLSLVAMVVFVWLSLMFGLFIMVKYILEFSIPLSGVVGSIVTGIVRVVAAVSIAMFWFLLWKKVAEFYFWKNVRKTN